MSGARGVGGILLSAALLIFAWAEGTVAGLSPAETAALVALFGVSLIMAGAIVEGFLRHWTYGVEATAISGGLVMALLVTYAARDELAMVIDRAIGDISFGRTVVTPEGEVVAARKTDGSFMIKAEVNGREARFVFDTGASTVVIRAEDAAMLGLRPDDLSYSIPVSTANGGALAAPIVIARLSVGPITEKDVPALVTRPGVLHANLLGMTFLERLASYEVRGNRLILRGKEARLSP